MKSCVCIYIVVFVALSFLFLPPLLILTVKLNESLKQYENALETAKINQACLKCYTQNKCAQCPDECLYMSINNSLCSNIPRSNQGRMVTGEEGLKEVILKVRAEQDYVGDALKHTIHKNFKNLSRRISSPKLTYALLTAKGQPKKIGTTHYNMSAWEWERGAKFAFVSDSSIYNNRSGVVTVPDSGLYLVYLHTTFESIDTHGLSCEVSHHIRRNGENLMSATESVSNCGFTNQTLTPWQKHQYCGFHTMDSAGIYTFRKDAKLSVVYTMPDYVKIGDTATQTYFGLSRL